MAIKKKQLYTALLAGILLLVIALPSKTPAANQKNDPLAASCRDGMDKPFPAGAEEYAKNLEGRLKGALEHVEGVGKADVMITLKSAGQKIIEKDYRSIKSSTDEADSAGGKRAEMTDDVERESVYVKGQAGEEKPYICKETAPEISGVLVVCEGGDMPHVVRGITEAVQALFGAEPHKIKIMKRTDK